ncbi:MAG TPA: hypothetical protein VGC25_09085 [Alphaproteobacteria bacterium]
METLTSREGLLGAALLAAGIAVLAWIATRWVTAALTRAAVLDRPNPRSSHGAPTPRGGGIAVLAVALPFMAGIYGLHDPANIEAFAVVVAAAALGALSWLDDLRGLPAALRLAAHAVAAAAVLALMPGTLLVFQGALPVALDRAAAALVWVWFVNLYNFMDGIDGIAGVETASIGAGLFAVALAVGGTVGPAAVALALAALVVAAAAIGFLALNWHPARVFLGDVGSIPLGFVLGWFLLTVAAWGYWAAALILPGYYLADATITVARRACRGEPVWRAHAEHFYQRAVRRGLGHGRVARFVLAGNIALAVLAFLSTQVLTATGDALCLGGAALVVTVMLAWLARGGGAGAGA